MRVEVFVGASTADLMGLDELIGRVKPAEADGLDSFWHSINLEIAGI